jgi:hypothetical protein
LIERNSCTSVMMPWMVSPTLPGTFTVSVPREPMTSIVSMSRSAATVT